jgi:ATP-dependent protease ClpP protease subunit
VSKIHPLSRIRDTRASAARDGAGAAPIAFWITEPTTTDNGDTLEVWFYDVVDDWYGISASMIVDLLLQADGRDVLFHVNSPGGLVTEGLAIYNTIRNYSGNVTMRIEGMAASAASFIMLAGDTVEVEPSAMVMIHDAWDISIGPASEHRKTADILDKASNNLARIYSDKADGTVESWRAAMIEETWYIGQEAVDAGLADTLTTATDDAGEGRNRWGGIFARAPRRQEQPHTPDPVVPASAPAASVTDPAPVRQPIEHRMVAVVPQPEPPAVPEDTTPNLADQLQGLDLAAIMKDALQQKGVPA